MPPRRASFGRRASMSAPRPNRSAAAVTILQASLSRSRDSMPERETATAGDVDGNASPRESDGVLDPAQVFRYAPAGSDDQSESAGKSQYSGVPPPRRGGGTAATCRGIPFTVWTCAAMLVPIALLVTTNALLLVATAQELDTINDHAPLAAAVGDCASSLMRERGTMGPYLARGTDDDFARLSARRREADTACRALLSEMQALVVDGRKEWRSGLDSFIGVLGELGTWRGQIDLRVADGRAARAFFTDAIATIGGELVIVTNALRQNARKFTELQQFVEVRNYIGLARGVGNAIAASPENVTTGADDIVHEYLAAYAQALAMFKGFRATADPKVRAALDAWRASPEAGDMWALLETMANVASGGVRRVQRNNATAWWPVVSAGLDALYHAEQRHLEDIRDADDARTELRNAILLMFCGLVACIVCGVLLALKQHSVRTHMDAQVTRIARTKEAVAAFVPRFFLHKMGYTSITQVRAGESTNVALAMLFSDIRRFTTISEGMCSSELFDWVQGYFQRMTAIVESRRGNVNQFIGDAMFAVFSTCNDALQCAIDMQADVQQLNVQRLCADETVVPIEIGVGIHHDVVALGILGDEKRHTCTAISASVNLASRLEGLTKQLGCKIIASDAALSQLSSTDAAAIRSRKLGPVVAKGASEPVTIHDVFQTDERFLQKYKAATKDDVARLIADVLAGRAPATIPATIADTMRNVELRAHTSSSPASPTAFPGATDSPRSANGDDAPAADLVFILPPSDEATSASTAPSHQRRDDSAEACLKRVTDALQKFGVQDMALAAFTEAGYGCAAVRFEVK